MHSQHPLITPLLIVVIYSLLSQGLQRSSYEEPCRYHRNHQTYGSSWSLHNQGIYRAQLTPIVHQANLPFQSAFNQQVIETMSALNPRPIIFPLSNPVRLSECEFNEAVEWSGGRVIFASGSPFPEQDYNGKRLYPGQGNNMYVFPGEYLSSFISTYLRVNESK